MGTDFVHNFWVLVHSQTNKVGGCVCRATFAVHDGDSSMVASHVGARETSAVPHRIVWGLTSRNLAQNSFCTDLKDLGIFRAQLSRLVAGVVNDFEASVLSQTNKVKFASADCHAHASKTNAPVMG